MKELIESMRLQGILTPVLVRPDDEDGYEMISGHRRMHAAQRLGLITIPAIVKEMTEDESTIAMPFVLNGTAVSIMFKSLYDYSDGVINQFL